jgi:cell division protease FtsH
LLAPIRIPFCSGEAMDKKSGRRLSLVNQGRHRNPGTCASTVAKFFKEHGRNILTGVLFIALLMLLYGIVGQLPAPAASATPQGVTVVEYDAFTVVEYDAFVDQIKAGNMLAVTIQGSDLTGTLAHNSQGQTCANSPAVAEQNPFASMSTALHSDPSCTVYTYWPAQNYATLLPLLLSHKVIVNTLPAKQSLAWVFFIVGSIPVVLILLIFQFNWPFTKVTLSSDDDQTSKFLKSHAHLFKRTSQNNQPGTETPSLAGKPAVSVKHPTSPVTFADVAGIDEVRAELEEVVQFLRHRERFYALGAYIPRGILLVGPPGTGKTLLAKAVAGEADVPYLQMSASEFVEMFVGVGASRVRDLFQQARQSAPCVVFIDEIDAVGRRRSIRLTDSGERDQTLNQLLIELDGFDSRNVVIVLAVTNRVDMLDAALLRPGRFDRQLSVSLPDSRGREAILRVHTRHTPLNSRVRLDELARLTAGMSGADLANLVNEAALYAARKDLSDITPECFEKALVHIQLGAQRSLVITEAERRIIALHESGHALVAHYLPEADAVSRITILPHGQRLGATQLAAQEDHYNYSRASLMARIAVGLGGRVAEELTFGPEGITTGAENDLQAVTALAWRMVTHWGMSRQVGVVFADYQQANSDALRRTTHLSSSTPRYVSSPGMAALIDSEVQCILSDGRATACALLTEHYDQLTRLAQALMEHEQLDCAQFETLLQK